jgi:hypothetical protein
VKLNASGTRILTLSSQATNANGPYRWAQLLRADAAGVQPLALPYQCDNSFTNAVLNAEGKYPVVSTSPVDGKWEAQLIASNKPHPAATNANPNLEHAYVYFMENEFGVSLV